VIAATALPTIVSDLGGANHLSWVVTSYLLAETIMTALVGKFGDLYGRKPMFLISVERTGTRKTPTPSPTPSTESPNK
jgi:MFS family permease